MWEYGAYIGYTSMIISMALVYFGVKHFRDQENGGQITLTKGDVDWVWHCIDFPCILYSLTWLVVYYNFSKFHERICRAWNSKTQLQAYQQKLCQKNKLNLMRWKNVFYPFGCIQHNLIRPLPVGILISILSAIVLRKNKLFPDCFYRIQFGCLHSRY